MLRRFLKFYKPHSKLFILDMLVAFIASGFSILFPFFTRQLLKVHIPDRNIERICFFLGLIFLIYMVTSLFTFIRIKWGHIMGVRMEYDMRNDLFRHIQKLSFTYFDNVKTGHIMSRISNDLNMITEVAHHAPEDLLISICVISGAFGFMFYLNPKMAFISLLPLPLMLVWGVFMGTKMKRNFRNVRQKIADINSTVENSVQGIREVKSYANEDLEIKKFECTNNNFRQSKENAYSIMGLFFSMMNFLRDFYYFVVLLGGTYFIFKKEMHLSDLVAFLLYVGIILPPIDRLLNFVEQYYQGIASFERFIEIMDIKPDIKDRKNAYQIDSLKGQIQFNEVSFKYEDNQEHVIKNINLNINPGQSIAIVGESGAGKSTIVSLIPRFYEAQKGEILIDQHNIMHLKQRFLRENIGIVMQNVFLFDTTIADNILYGKPGATEVQLVEAAKMANIYDFIMSLPGGFNTMVGERGVKLSGGQKQRISIARVFLKNPPILIFDEATSALDTESEQLIQEAMIRLSRNRTTIIIAHRLSTVKHVDQLFVMKDGNIVEQGTHENLISAKGYYYKLYSKNLL